MRKEPAASLHSGLNSISEARVATSARVFLLLLCAALFLSVPSLYKRWTYGFKITKLHLHLPWRPEWDAESALPQEALSRILAQPFSFLGKGAQCYAFLSRDGGYVLKLFRFDKSKDELHWSRSLSAYKLAYALARNETALVYLHLNLSPCGTLPILHARSPVGQSFHIPLDNYRFALQRKAEPFLAGLRNASTQGELLALIDSFFDLLNTRIGRQIGNTDPSLWRNFGFIDKQAVEIDCGNYIQRPDLLETDKARLERERYALILRAWLEKNAPESLSHFDERMAVL